MEPYKLRRWRSRLNNRLEIYTCARPGRSRGADGAVSDSIVDNWIKGLPGEGKVTIVSLLGRKPNGDSEFKFYSFHGKSDTASERKKKPSFQEWIDRRNYDRSIQVIEHPTQDFRPILTETADAVSIDVQAQLDRGSCVVLVDSGGETRTRKICSLMHYAEDSSAS